MRVRISNLILTLCIGAACGGDDPTHRPAAASVPAASETSAVGDAPSGPVDPALAAEGEALFQSKGCAACHTIGGGRLTGPDLAGVTERREFGWVVAMITNPDSMLRADPTARELFAEYMTPMLGVGATQRDARALYEYLRRDDS